MRRLEKCMTKAQVLEVVNLQKNPSDLFVVVWLGSRNSYALHVRSEMHPITKIKHGMRLGRLSKSIFDWLEFVPEPAENETIFINIARFQYKSDKTKVGYPGVRGVLLMDSLREVNSNQTA